MTQWQDFGRNLEVLDRVAPKGDVFIWQSEVDGRAVDVPVEYMYSHNAFRADSDPIHVYAGLGEERRAAYRAVQALGKLGLPSIAVIAPFHHLEVTEANILRTAIELPHAFMEGMNQRVSAHSDTPRAALGSSQGGGIVALSAIEAPELFKEIVLSEPVGFTPSDFVGHPVSSFIWRLGVRNNLRREQVLDPFGMAMAGTEMFHRLGYDALHRHIFTKLHTAFKFDLTKGFVERAVPDHDVAVFANTRDPLFPYASIHSSFAEHGREDLVHRRNSSHTNFNMRAGIRDLLLTAEWIRDRRATRN